MKRKKLDRRILIAAVVIGLLFFFRADIENFTAGMKGSDITLEASGKSAKLTTAEGAQITIKITSSENMAITKAVQKGNDIWLKLSPVE